MTIERKASSIESSFRMEDMDFDNECIERVKGILSGKILVSDAIDELNEKYNVSKPKQEKNNERSDNINLLL